MDIVNTCVQIGHPHYDLVDAYSKLSLLLDEICTYINTILFVVNAFGDLRYFSIFIFEITRDQNYSTLFYGQLSRIFTGDFFGHKNYAHFSS